MNRRLFTRTMTLGSVALALHARRSFASLAAGKEYDVRRFGAIGDDVAVDTAAIQKAIDTAAAQGGGRIILPAGKQFLCGAIVLKSGIDFHLADGTVMLANPDPADYGSLDGLLNGSTVQGLKISGGGHMDGQGMKFVTTYSETDERWEPKKFRPRMFSLKRCNDLEISDLSFGHSPNWGMHLLGCERVQVHGVRVRNYMDVPNCDGIDPDHCRDVEISNCDIVGADDAIVIKTSDQPEDYGPSRNIVVKDCVVTSRDSGLKIGTETFSDISKIVFERCKVLSGGRGPKITHRQRGNIEDIEFRDIELVAEHHAARWWGWGEAASITAWPRTADGKVGTLRNVRLENIRGRAENSLRIDGMPGQPIRDVTLDNIAITLDRWTKYPGGHFDNRPVRAGVEGLESHGIPGIFLRNLAGVTVRNSRVNWGDNRQPDFTYALEAVQVTGLNLESLEGDSAYPKLLPKLRL